MHRLFVTYKGQPLVVGTEDDLITIPEPGIEVNEILGSEEVTEKIAEDVAVGDVLYKSTRYVDNFEGGTAYFPNKTTITSFEGEMYVMSESVNLGMPHTFKNEDGRWVDQTERRKDNYRVGNLNRGILGSFASSKYIYNIVSRVVSERSGGVGYTLRRFENGLWVDVRPKFSDLHTDASSVDGLQTGYSIKGLMYEGKIHLPLIRRNTSESFFTPYIYDEDTNTLEKVDCDASSTTTAIASEGCSELVVHDGSLYCIHASHQYVYLYKYDSSSNRWNYITETLAGGGDSYSLSTSSGLFVSLNDDSNYGLPQLIRFDTDLSSAYKYTLPADPENILYRTTHTGIWEEDGHIYIFGAGLGFNGRYQGAHYTAKLNLTTSSITALSGVMTWKCDESQTVGDGYHPGSFHEHNGEKYAVIHKGSLQTPHVMIFKWDSSNQKWEDISYWGTFQDSGVRTASPIDVYEYRGVHYVAKESYNSYLKFGKFITSGDPSGYFDNVSGLDTRFTYRPAACKFYETSGQLYCFVAYNSTTNPAAIYQLTDHEVGYFNKLDQTAVSAIGNKAVYSYSQPSIVEFSGTNFLAISHVSPASNPAITTYTLEGSSLVALPDLSSAGATVPDSIGYKGVELKVYNNELFMFYSTTSNSNPSFYCWKWNGSNWVDVTVLNSFNSRASSSPYTLSGNLYVLITDDEGSESSTLYKYDGSSFDIDYTEDPVQPHDPFYTSPAIVVNDTVHVFCEGYQGAGPVSTGMVRKPNGSWYIFACHPGAGIANCPISAFRVGDDVFSIQTTFTEKNQGVLSKVKKEFFGEHVWYKRDLAPSLYDLKSSAAGIALESGSKGDTIRIQKVKR